MAQRKEPTWQLRLGRAEDEIAAQLAERQRVSKNAVVNQMLRLAALIEKERASGARVLIERIDSAGVKNLVELWLLI